MVTIKIQSANDIIVAYLSSFGFSKKDSQVEYIATDFLTRNLHINHIYDEIIGEFNKKVVLLSKKIYTDKEYDDIELISLFRANFILCEGSKKWPLIFSDNFKPEEDFIKVMRKNEICPIPEIKIIKMTPQRLEAKSFSNLLKKIKVRIFTFFKGKRNG